MIPRNKTTFFDLTYKTNQNDLIYYLKNNTARKGSDVFRNSIELFQKITSGEMKLEEAKDLQNVFKSIPNKISRGRYKSQEQKIALENIKQLYKSR